MAADLHIHVLTDDVTEQDLSEFFRNTMGSKYFNPVCVGHRSDDTWKKVADTPQCWIGEVSWLKAALFGDDEGPNDEFLPGPVVIISDLIGEELPILNDELIGKILDAFKATNDTSYRVANPEEVRTFLEEHRGRPVFTVSW